MTGSDIHRRQFLSAGAVSAAAALGAPLRAGADETTTSTSEDSLTAQDAPPPVDALTFDVWGTTVDWRTSLIREGQLLSATKGIGGDSNWEDFADEWIGRRRSVIGRVRSGDLPWMDSDEMHRIVLDQLVPEFGLGQLSEEDLDELNRAWHRLIPWPDAVLGLTRLRSRYLVVSLSNSNVISLTVNSKQAGLPWDLMLSGWQMGVYKIAPGFYQAAAGFLKLPPERIMMVSTHRGDLRAAAAQGFRTAFVPRVLEYGPDVEVDATPDPDFDIHAVDFLDLARQMGT